MKITKSQLREIIREEIRRLNEGRVTAGKETVYNLNQDTPQQFVKGYSDEDIFFTEDGKAVVTNRSSNIVHHGKDGGKGIAVSNIKFVYCGPEKQFYSVEDYKKILKAVYAGKRASVTPLRNITEAK